MSLKAPAPFTSLQPVLSRGFEIKAADPIVAYYCFYLAVSEVLETKLHTTDSDVAEFAAALLSEIEAMKNPGGALDNDDARDILDNDDASRAHVLNFATSIFEKAERATHTNNVTRATGAGFAAAAVFLGLDAVWEPLTPETTEKIKFAKYQAARILRAIKDGIDPNTLFAEERDIAEDPETGNDAVEASDTVSGDTRDTVPNNTIPSDTIPSDTIPSDTIPSDTVPDPVKQEEERTNTEPEPISEINDNSSAQDQTESADLPEAPNDDPSKDLQLPPTPKANLKDDIALPPAPQSTPEGNTEPSVRHPGPPRPPKPSPTKPVPETRKVPAPKPAQKSSAENSLSPADIMNLTKASGSAQKHAKYAISALNYDDVPTAIAELEAALSVLKMLQSNQ